MSLILVKVKGHEIRQKPEQAGQIEVCKNEHPSDQEGMNGSKFQHVCVVRQVNHFAIRIANKLLNVVITLADVGPAGAVVCIDLVEK